MNTILTVGVNGGVNNECSEPELTFNKSDISEADELSSFGCVRYCNLALMSHVTEACQWPPAIHKPAYCNTFKSTQRSFNASSNEKAIVFLSPFPIHSCSFSSPQQVLGTVD